MARITDITARYSGTVTYADNTKEYFHTQLYRDQIWSVDEAQSRRVESKLKWFPVDGDEDVWYLRQRLLWTMGADIDATPLRDDRIINGVIMHVRVDFELDNGQNVSSSALYETERGWIIEGTILADLPFIENMSENNFKLEAMLRRIVNTAALTP
jgi:hypothetical protein